MRRKFFARLSSSVATFVFGPTLLMTSLSVPAAGTNVTLPEIGVSATWNSFPDTALFGENRWSFLASDSHGDSVGSGGSGESSPLPYLIQFGPTLKPTPWRFSGLTAEERGAPAITGGFFTLNGVTYNGTNQPPLPNCPFGILNCAQISAEGSIDVTFTAPVAAGSITMPAVMSVGAVPSLAPGLYHPAPQIPLPPPSMALSLEK